MKESIALPDFLVVGFLVGVDLALVDDDFLPEVLVLADLDPVVFLAGLTSVNLGEVLAPLVLLFADFVVFGLAETDLTEALLLTATLVVLAFGLALELALFLVVDLLEVDLVSGM